MDHNTLQKLYLLQLKDLFSAERQLAESLPKMAKAVSNKELKTALREHLEITKVQASRIEEIVKAYDSHPSGEVCNAIEGLIEEVEELIEEQESKDAIDISIISSCQKIEHFQIAAYGTVITYAKGLGDERGAEMLQQSLDEEYEMDNKLDKLAEDIVQIYSKIHNYS